MVANASSKSVKAWTTANHVSKAMSAAVEKRPINVNHVSILNIRTRNKANVFRAWRAKAPTQNVTIALIAKATMFRPQKTRSAITAKLVSILMSITESALHALPTKCPKVMVLVAAPPVTTMRAQVPSFVFGTVGVRQRLNAGSSLTRMILVSSAHLVQTVQT